MDWLLLNQTSYVSKIRMSNQPKCACIFVDGCVALPHPLLILCVGVIILIFVTFICTFFATSSNKYKVVFKRYVEVGGCDCFRFFFVQANVVFLLKLDLAYLIVSILEQILLFSAPYLFQNNLLYLLRYFCLFSFVF